MKKILVNFITLVISSLILTSCEPDSSANISDITNYPNFELEGGSELIIKKGSTFTDPGVKVTEGTTIIPHKVSVTAKYQKGTTLDTNKPDIYTVTYSAVNKDGFSGTATRTVIVVEDGDLVNSLSGLYTVTCSRDNAAPINDMKYILIWQNTDGSYELSDGIGLYYAVGRAYGDNYLARPTIVTANDIPNNDYEFNSFVIPGFLSSGSGNILSLSADPTTKTISYSSLWAGYKFDVVLSKVQI